MPLLWWIHSRVWRWLSSKVRVRARSNGDQFFPTLVKSLILGKKTRRIPGSTDFLSLTTAVQWVTGQTLETCSGVYSLGGVPLFRTHERDQEVHRVIASTSEGFKPYLNCLFKSKGTYLYTAGDRTHERDQEVHRVIASTSEGFKPYLNCPFKSKGTYLHTAGEDRPTPNLET